MTPTLAVVAFLLAWIRRPLWQMTIVLLSTPMWVVLGNGLRMAIVAFLVESHRFAADSGAAFVVGWTATFVVAVGLSMSFAELLQFARMFRRPRAVNDVLPPRNTATLPQWAIYAIVGASLISLAFQIPSWFSRSINTSAAAKFDPSSVPDSAIPEGFGPFVRTGASLASGDRFDVKREASKRWEFKAPFAQATVFLNRPVRDWDELPSNLKSTGWIVGKREVRNLEINGSDVTVVEIAVSKPATTQIGRVWFALFDQNGNSAPPPGDELVRRIVRHPTPSQIVTALRADADGRTPLVQLQLFVDGLEPLVEKDREAADAFFLDACRRIVELSTSGGATP